MPTIVLNGLSVFYERHGQGDAILLIHGLGSSTEDWELQIDALQRDFTVVAYDVRGHGRSDKPPGKYSIAQFANDAALLIEHLHLGPLHVMGLSMGGMIAFQLAADRPDLVRSLIIVNSGPELIARTWKEKFGLFQRRQIVRFMGMRNMGAVLAGRLLPAAEHAGLRETFADRWARNDRATYLRVLSALVGWSVKARLPDITCPVLVVTADNDYSSVDLKREYTALMPNASLVIIPDSRHMMPVERPELFHAAIVPFLKSVPASA